MLPSWDPLGRSQPVIPGMRFRPRPSPVMRGSAVLTVLQSASPRADFSGLPGSLLQRPSSCSPLVRSVRLTRSKTNAAFGRPAAIGTSTGPGRFFAGHKTMSSSRIDAVDCEGHLKGLGNHLPNIRQDAGLAVAAFPCRASARAESCPKWFWAVRKIRCVVCACKG